MAIIKPNQAKPHHTPPPTPHYKLTYRKFTVWKEGEWIKPYITKWCREVYISQHHKNKSSWQFFCINNVSFPLYNFSSTTQGLVAILASSSYHHILKSFGDNVIDRETEAQRCKVNHPESFPPKTIKKECCFLSDRNLKYLFSRDLVDLASF